MLLRTDRRAPTDRVPSPPARTSILLVVLVATLACRSADDWAADADREVYEILTERRTELVTGEREFTIEPPADSLRLAILAGEVGRSAEEPLELDLLDCLEIGAENSRTYRTQRETLFLAALDLTLERWDFDLQGTGGASATLLGRGSTAESVSFDPFFRLGQLLGFGADLVLDVGLNVARVISTGDPWEAISDSSFRFAQPLLRGFGRRIQQEPLTQAERNVVYAARDYERFRRTFAVDVANRYYRILAQRDTLGNEQRNQERLVELRERSEDLAEAGRRSEIEVDQARQDALRAGDRVIQVTQDYQATLDDFKLFLGVPIETQVVLADESGLELAVEDAILRLEEERAVAVATTERLDFLTTLDRHEDTVRRAGVIADSLRAGLGVSGGVRAESVRDEPLDVRPGSADWDLRLDFDLPVNLIPERNDYRRALVRREAARREVEQAADRIRLDLRNLRRELDSAAASLAIQEGAVVLADRRVEGADLSLQAGRSSTRDLLEAREDLVEAQNQRVRLATDLTLAGLDYLLAIERLRVDEEGIRVDREGLELVETALEDEPAQLDAPGVDSTPTGATEPTRRS